MPHYYVRPEGVKKDRFVIDGREAHHLAAVLRKKSGDIILLFDGIGGNYRAKIETAASNLLEGEILSEVVAPALPYTLRLFQGLPKGDKFDFILQKITELGAAEIIPVYTERSVAKIPPERLSERLKRWERIVMSAAKQCGLSKVPTVHSPHAFDRCFALCAKTDVTLFPYEGESDTSLKKVLALNVPASILSPVFNVFIGPEGGFSHHEVELAKKHGATPVTLGPLILRTETAGLFAAANIMYERGAKTP